MAVWPTTLPTRPDRSSYQEIVPNTVIRTAMDAGPPKMRQRYTAGIRGFDLSFMMTKAQVATLDAFYITTLVGGSLSFTWVHPRTEAAATFRFVEPPQYQAMSGSLYRVTAKMEILP